MAVHRVTVNKLYEYRPVGVDMIDPPYGVEIGLLESGDIVRVINIFGTPPVNTMNHCYIESINGDFLGMVCCNSLHPNPKN